MANLFIMDLLDFAYSYDLLGDRCYSCPYNCFCVCSPCEVYDMCLSALELGY